MNLINESKNPDSGWSVYEFMSCVKSLNLALTVSIHNKSIGSLKKRSWMRSFCLCEKPKRHSIVLQKKTKGKAQTLSETVFTSRSPPRTDQILLIFGFMHSWIAAGRLLRLKRVALSCSNRVYVRRLLVHLLELHVWLELVWHLWKIGTRRIDCHHLSCGAAF